VSNSSTKQKVRSQKSTKLNYKTIIYPPGKNKLDTVFRVYRHHKKNTLRNVITYSDSPLNSLQNPI
jgi:hypothetical protein